MMITLQTRLVLQSTVQDRNNQLAAGISPCKPELQGASLLVAASRLIAAVCVSGADTHVSTL